MVMAPAAGRERALISVAVMPVLPCLAVIDRCGTTQRKIGVTSLALTTVRRVPRYYIMLQSALCVLHHAYGRWCLARRMVALP
jgi:hypothetical protein